MLHPVQSKDSAVLQYCIRKLLYGIHSAFLPPAISGNTSEDPVSLTKLEVGEGMWEVRKKLMCWLMDGAILCPELAKKK